MRTRYKIVCECGREGAVLMSENDQPFSKMWESYSLINFNGGSFRVEGYEEPGNILKRLEPTCPSCDSKNIQFKN